jgi:hypothetical protein
VKIEYRTPTGTGSYVTLADEATGTLGERISGYSARPGQSALFRGGLWVVSFMVDRVHASADAAALFVSTQGAIFAVPGVFGRVNFFDLKITIGSQVLYSLMAGCTGFSPAPASDQTSLISYTFSWGSYA